MTEKTSELGLTLQEIFDENTSLDIKDRAEIDLPLAVKLTDKISHLEEEAERYKRWAEIETTKIKTKIEGIKGFLQCYAEDRMAESGNKTFNLPNGYKLQFRKKPATIELPEKWSKEENEALVWANTNLPTAVKTEYSLLKKEIISHLRSSGELPPNVTVKDTEKLSFSIQYKGKNNE